MDIDKLIQPISKQHLYIRIQLFQLAEIFISQYRNVDIKLPQQIKC